MPNYCYPKTNRLLKSDDFKHVFNNAKLKVHQSHLMVFVAKSDKPEIVTTPRLGMAITKKKVPTAVARNRIKRKIKEYFRHHASTLPIYDMVFIVKQPMAKLSSEQLDDQIKQAFNKVQQKLATA